MNDTFKYMTFSQKTEHIWYYYKWYIIVGVFLAAFVTFVCVQCSEQKPTDLQLVIVTDINDRTLTDASCAELAAYIQREYASDTNGDGKVTVGYKQYTVTADGHSADKTTKQALTIEIYDGSNFLFLCDETGYRQLLSMGEGTELQVLEPLGEDYRVSLDGTALGELETVNEEKDQQLFACLRVYTGSSAEGKKEKEFSEAKRILDAIVNDKK